MISSFCNSEQLSVSSIALHQSCHCSSPAREVLLLLCPRLKLNIFLYSAFLTLEMIDALVTIYVEDI